MTMTKSMCAPLFILLIANLGEASPTNLINSKMKLKAASSLQRKLAQADDTHAARVFSPDEIAVIMKNAKVRWEKCQEYSAKSAKLMSLLAGLKGNNKQGKNIFFKNGIELLSAELTAGYEALLKDALDGKPADKDYFGDSQEVFLDYVKKEAKGNKSAMMIVNSLPFKSTAEMSKACSDHDDLEDFFEYMDARTNKELADAKIDSVAKFEEFYNARMDILKQKLKKKEITLSDPEFWYLEEGFLSRGRMLDLNDSAEKFEAFETKAALEISMLTAGINESDKTFPAFMHNLSEALRAVSASYEKKIESALQDKEAAK